MDNYYGPEVPETKKNTLGIISLVLGILGIVLAWCSCAGIPFGLGALICGIIAKQQNQDFAVAGIVLGAVSLVIGIIYIILVGVYAFWLETFVPEFMEEFI